MLQLKSFLSFNSNVLSWFMEVWYSFLWDMCPQLWFRILFLEIISIWLFLLVSCSLRGAMFSCVLKLVLVCLFLFEKGINQFVLPSLIKCNMATGWWWTSIWWWWDIGNQAISRAVENELVLTYNTWREFYLIGMIVDEIKLISVTTIGTYDELWSNNLCPCWDVGIIESMDSW